MTTVAEVLAVASLGLESVFTPHPQASVTWVSTTELPDISAYLEGGEIVLTTGVTMPGDADGWDEFVAGLALAGAAGLGFGIEIAHPELPSALMAAAQKWAVNLFVVPPPVPFIAVSKAVADLLVGDELVMTRRALSAQREILNSAVGSGGSAAILDRLARATRARVAVVDAVGRPILEAGKGALPPLRETITRMLARGQSSLSESGPDGTLYVHPLGLEPGVAERMLVVWTASPPPPTSLGAITAAAIVLSLDHEKTAAGDRTAGDVRRRLAVGLVSGDSTAVTTALRFFRPDTRLPESVCVLRASAPRAVRHRLTARLDRGRDLLPLWCEPQRVEHEPGAGGDLLIVAAPEDAPGIADEIIRGGGRVGIGRVAPLADAPGSLQQSSWALARCTVRHPVVDWAESPERRVHDLISAPEADAFAHSVLGSLLPKTHATGTLLDSLAEYLSLNGNAQATAAQLNIHRNTLRLRLARIEEATGLSLDSMPDRVDLWVALRTLRSIKPCGRSI